MMKLKSLMGVFLLLLALVSLVSAVDYNLSGHVLDSSGSAVSGATVQIVGGSSNTSVADGAYGLVASASNYTVYAEKSGYYRQVRSINLYQDTVQNFTLSAPNYTVSDVDDIVIDTAATAMVEVKGDVPTLVDLGVLYLFITILIMVVGGIVAIFYIVPKMIAKKSR